MSKVIKFNVKLLVDGKEQLVTATGNAKELGRSLAEANKSAQKMSSGFSRWGFGAMALSSLTTSISALTSAMHGLLDESYKFNSAMRAANTMAGKSSAEFKQLKNQVAELAETIPIARDALAKGLYQVISNGVPEDNWITFLEASAKSSVGGIADLEEVVKVTSTIIKNYGMEWSDAQAIQDKIQLTAKNGVTSFEQLAAALPSVTGQAAQLGVSLDEMLAVMATLTGVTGNTSEVSTQLASVLTALTKESAKNNWLGVGRLYRAWQHYKVVRNYGDCYWVEKELDSNDADILCGPRQPRNSVMDKVLEDLNFACDNITMNATSHTAFNQYVALAIKAQICLYEGTYSKYVKNDNARANTYLTQAKQACEKIMNSGKFSLNPDFQANFNSLDLKENPEMIMYKHYVKGSLTHGTIDYTCGSTQVKGMTKDAFDSYLFRDGKPLATTTMDKSDKGVIVTLDDNFGFGEAKHIDISAVLANRDPRLSAQVDKIIQFPGSGYARFGGAQSTASTGYGVWLFDSQAIANLSNAERQSTNGNYTDAPVFRYAEILLNYAEACAELGNITDADLNKSINLLRDRVGMPHLTTAVEADPANNMGISNIIWEIRRERRVEMMYSMNDRYLSLQRWNKLELLDTENHPNICRGAFVAGYEGLDLTQVNIDADGYINCKNGVARKWDPKYNLYPIPGNQKNLNPEIGQNPGW